MFLSCYTTGNSGSAVEKMMLTVSCQNSVLLQPIPHLFKVFKSSDLLVLQFTDNFGNLYEISYQCKKREGSSEPATK